MGGLVRDRVHEQGKDEIQSVHRKLLQGSIQILKKTEMNPGTRVMLPAEITAGSLPMHVCVLIDRCSSGCQRQALQGFIECAPCLGGLFHLDYDFTGGVESFFSFRKNRSENNWKQGL